MTSSQHDPPTTLAEAEALFSIFLASNGFPSRIRWITGKHLVIDGDSRLHFVCADGADVGRAEANRRYTEGLAKGFGVILQAFCATSNESLAGVAIPASATEAQYRRVHRSLKCLCPTSQIPASIVRDPIQWESLSDRFRSRKQLMRQAYDL